MGNCVSFQVSCDQALNQIFRCLCGKGYIRNLKENLKSLEREMEDLKAIQHDVQNKVAGEEETRHPQRLEAVQVWLTRVDNIDLQIKNLLSTCPVQLQKLCLCGLCSKNVRATNMGKAYTCCWKMLSNSNRKAILMWFLCQHQDLEWRRGLLNQRLVRIKFSKRHGIALWKMESESWAFMEWVVFKTSVVMHDVVREMARWIASDFGKQKENFVVRAGVGSHEIPEVKDWGAVRRMSLMKNNIEEITCGSKCSELTTLFLQNNELRNLSGEFIRCMQKLVVLDLSWNRNFSELPEQISELASLQYLDLSYTNIEQLPVGFRELKNLTQLNLSWTERLCSVGAISKLSSLRILKLICSNVHVDVSLMKELQQRYASSSSIAFSIFL